MDYNPEGHEDEPWYQHAEGVGYNYNVTDLQAALGLAQLDRLDEFKRRRDEIIERYDDAFGEMTGIHTPPEVADADPLYHLYVIGVTDEFGCDRQEFVNAMHAENIGVQVHYVPLHLHPLFRERYRYGSGDFPLTEEIYRKIVSLPLHPEMSDQDIFDVIGAVKRLANYFSR